ncbi:CLUMA_CG014022, isoform A [Clunio marinus]|uniref:peptidyl-tRNA hydrolase n=1 Tax=Clunio marinus TaxID=568069 RepID=A0A1J1IKK3_9DIPT|nr:CLUMA_CG014022, isoform A [Clunio marinus]
MTLIQYIIVRSDLIKVMKWSIGAVITQACHAVAAINEITKTDEATKQYLSPENLNKMHKCVLSISDQISLENLSKALDENGIIHKLCRKQNDIGNPSMLNKLNVSLRFLVGSPSLLFIAGASFLSCIIISIFINGLLGFFIFSGTILGLFYTIQDNFLFYPDIGRHRICVPSPQIYGLPFEVVYIKTRDKLSLHSYFIRHPEPKAESIPTFVYFHGNAGNIGGRLQNCNGIFHNLQCNILIVEYRGYGLSNGTPSEKGLYIDARAAVDYLFTRHDLDHSQIILFGRSLGGAIVIDVAADPNYGNKIMCSIVENTFTSIPNMAHHLIRQTKCIPRFCHKNKFDSIKKIQKISSPILFISGLSDSLVPSSMMTDLYNRCKSSHKQLFQLSGGHMDTWNSTGYYQGIAQFLMKCEVQKTTPKQVSPPTQLSLWPVIEEV